MEHEPEPGGQRAAGATEDTGATEDVGGSLARERWRRLPEPVRREDLVAAQPVPRDPAPEQDDELARALLWWGAG